MLESFPKQSNVLIVGASRGIGLGLARALAAELRIGKIFCAMRAPEDAAPIHALAEKDCRVRALRMDVADEQTIADAVAEVQHHTDMLHLVIVAAGVLHDGGAMQPERRLADLTVEAATQAWRVNALGPALVLKHVQPLLNVGGRACFASISARVGSIGDNRLGGWYAYRSAKAAQNQFIHTAALELARRYQDLVCVTLHPGTVDTELSRPFQRGVKPGQLFDIERACGQLLGVVDQLTPAQSGGFYTWDGQAVPW